MISPVRLKAKRTDICMPGCDASAPGGSQQARSAANRSPMVSTGCSGSTRSPCLSCVDLTVTCRFSPSGNGYCGWHGSPSSGLHTVGVHGLLSSTLQVVPPNCASATAASAAQAQAAPPSTAYRPSRRIAPLLHVGCHLHLDHLVRVLHRLAL